jgi:hypothetical protein
MAFFLNKNHKIDITLAKLYATIPKLFNNCSPKSVRKLYNDYCKYKIRSDKFVIDFNLDAIDKSSLEELRTILKKESLFYSYCFDYYKYLPVIIALQGYSVTVLLGDRVYHNQIEVFNKLIQSLEIKFNKKINITLLPHNSINIIYKLKSLLSMEQNKIIIYVDGNKGLLDNDKHLFICKLKKCKILFHKGYAMLCWLLRMKETYGLICKYSNEKLLIQIINDNFRAIKNKDEYIDTLSQCLINNLSSLLDISNIHKWDALVSVYQWFVIEKESKSFDKSSVDLYVPFYFDMQYYALDKKCFVVYPINKKMYLHLQKSY